MTSITIPDGVTSIGDYAFYDCSSLTSITIPDGVTSIGNYVFYGCSGLTSITIPDGVTSIGDYAFYDCSSLTSITIPNGVTSIGDYAFYDCYIKSMTIGSGVLSIGSGQCIPRKTIWLTNTPPSGYKNLDGIINYVANNLYSDSPYSVKVYPYLSSIFEVDGVKYVPVNPSERTCDAVDCDYDGTMVNMCIGETVLYRNVKMKVQQVMPYTFYEHTSIQSISLSNNGSIGRAAFCGCSSLVALTLGENISSIGAYAFDDCSSLTKAKIPNKVTELGAYCFSGCKKLADVGLGLGIKTIGECCFRDCAIQSISIPANVTLIGDCTFQKCKNLSEVIIDDRTTDLFLGSNGSSPLFADCPLNSVYIGGNISYLTSSSYGYSPFYRNTSLRSVVITDKEDEIPDNAFYGCTSLKKVTIGNKVEKIGKWAFSGCSNLDYFLFGRSVKSIGQEAFSDCVNMTKLISYATTPPTCGTQALDDINKWNCTLMVPSGTIATYQTAEQWKEFFFVEGLAVSKYQITYIVDGEVLATDSVEYGASIALREEPQKEGHTFSGWSEVPETMPAEDVVVTGSFTVNKYLLTFVIDEVVFATDSVDYGAEIVLPDVPVKENCTFVWEEERPKTMPACDVTIHGSYITGIRGVENERKVDVYTISGILYKKGMNANQLEKELPRGLYIIDGKKFRVK